MSLVTGCFEDLSQLMRDWREVTAKEHLTKIKHFTVRSETGTTEPSVFFPSKQQSKVLQKHDVY